MRRPRVWCTVQRMMFVVAIVAVDLVSIHQADMPAALERRVRHPLVVRMRRELIVEGRFP